MTCCGQKAKDRGTASAAMFGIANRQTSIPEVSISMAIPLIKGT